MKKLFTLLALGLSLSVGTAYAADASCDAKAAEKKLAGAAKTSFLKKCNADAGTAASDPKTAACEKSAADKKLHGAAKNSHVKKCMADGAAPAAAASEPAKK